MGGILGEQGRGTPGQGQAESVGVRHLVIIVSAKTMEGEFALRFIKRKRIIVTDFASSPTPVYAMAFILIS